MIGWLDTLFARVTDWHPTRRMIESCLRLRTRRHLKRLACDDIKKVQARILRGLVHRARSTRFGKEHDFGRVRSVEDFRRLVAVTTPAELAARYWEPAFPWLARATWPGEVARVLDKPLPGCPYLPLTQEFLQNAANVWMTGLAQILALYPRRRLLAGRLLGLVDPVREPLVAATWSQLPWTVRPYLYYRDGEQFDETESAYPTTALLGTSAQLAALVRRFPVGTRLTDLWPDLLGVLVQRTHGDTADHDTLTFALDRRAVLVEVVVGPHGVFAVEDVRRGGLRLLVEGGGYYELLQGEDRFGIEQATPGVVYELATTTAAGLWACRTGVGVVFDEPGTQRLRFVPLPLPPAPPPVPVLAPTNPVPKPVRPRSTDGASVPVPGSALRMPWFAQVNRS